MKYYLCICLLLSIGVLGSAKKLFRCDYSYYTKAEGWMKVHLIPTLWAKAVFTCRAEGAELASPITPGILDTMKALMNNKIITVSAPSLNGPTTPEIKIFTGFSEDSSFGDFVSMEGVPLTDIEYEWAHGAPFNFIDSQTEVLLMDSDGKFSGNQNTSSAPFMCYRRYEKMTLTNCGTVDREYKMAPGIDICYKYHKVPLEWFKAYKMCTAEGGHLVVINSPKEADVIKNLIADNVKLAPTNPNTNSNIFIGAMAWAMAPDTLLTIQRQTLEQAGFNTYKYQNSGGTKGAFSQDGIITNVDGNIRLPFICEKEPNWPQC